MFDSEANVVIRVEPHIWTEDIWVLIPPRLWATHPNVPECIKMAVQKVFSEPSTTPETSEK